MRSTGVHHVDLVVSDIGRSLAFYREILSLLGWHGVSTAPGERGETIHYLFGPGSSIGLRQAPTPEAGLPVDRYRIGLHHLCLEVDEPSRLEEAAHRLRELGALITDGPREFPEYRPGTRPSSSKIQTASSSSSSGRLRGRTTTSAATGGWLSPADRALQARAHAPRRQPRRSPRPDA